MSNTESHWDKLAYKKHDLTNCESEPLAFCGAIQPVGAFLGVSLDSKQIIAVSENSEEFLKIKAQDLLGRPAEDFLSFSDGGKFDIDLALHLSKGGPLLVKSPHDHKAMLASVFQNEAQICVDLEFVDSYTDLRKGKSFEHQFPVQDLKHLIHIIDEQKDFESVVDKAAKQISLITGFDRVMIYRFEENWDGQVVAEAIRDGLNVESYLGLFYPATDIPSQARRLYFESRYRMIVDSHLEPVSIVTQKGLGKSEIDLSCCAFRASSPIHLQYLQNMGVRASFSLPIKHNGRLWGLISCHAYSQGVHPSREIRSACELASQVLSGRIGDLVNERRLRIKREIAELTSALLSSVTAGAPAVKAFESVSKELLNMTSSSGAFVRIGGSQLMMGDCPDAGFIEALIEKLSEKHALALWQSNKVSQELGIEFDVEAAGVLAVPLSLGFEDVLIWFRPEFIREVKWGGKPQEAAEKLKKLEPRSSFSSWSEIVKGSSRPWTESDSETAQYLLFAFVQGIFKKAGDLSRANLELERVAKAKDEFIGMVSHELRTPLGVMIGWLDILKDYQFRDSEVTKALEVLDRNAKLQINLINDLLDVSRVISGKMRVNPEADVDIGALAADVVAALQPTASAKDISLKLESNYQLRVVVDTERIRQVLWNLIANAIKFTPKHGAVTVSIRHNSSSFEIEIADTGIGLKPESLATIFNRFEQIGADGARTGGLGLGLSIVKSLVELHGGRIEVASEGLGKGSRFIVRLPVYALTQMEHVSPVHVPYSRLQGDTLKGLRILLAEDQVDSAEALSKILERQGAKVKVTHDGKTALQILMKEQFDLILSDIGMPEMDGYELIRKWRHVENERQVSQTPAIALTAFATSSDRTKALTEGFQSHVPKPVDRGELLVVIESIRNRN